MLRSGKHNPMLEGVLHNGCVCIQVQRIHQPVLVKRNSTGGQVEYGSDLFHRLAFGEQLQNFDLSLGQRYLLVLRGHRRKLMLHRW